MICEAVGLEVVIREKNLVVIEPNPSTGNNWIYDQFTSGLKNK
jgi:hypothetical protein